MYNAHSPADNKMVELKTLIDTKRCICCWNFTSNALPSSSPHHHLHHLSVLRCVE